MDKKELQLIPEDDLKQYYLEYMRRYRIKNKDKIQYAQNKYNKKRLTINRKDVTINGNSDKTNTINRNTNNDKSNNINDKSFNNNDKSLNNIGDIFK